MSRIFKMVAVAWVGVFLSRAAFAACTTLRGTIANRVLTEAESPYCVTGELRIAGGVVIEPGVQFLVSSPYTIHILSADLLAVGTPEKPIVFKTRVVNSRWGGIVLRDLPPGARLEHFQVSDCSSPGITIWNCLPRISHGTVSNCTGESESEGAGIHISIDKAMALPALVLEDLVVSHNGSAQQGGGIYAKVSPTKLILQDCQIADNKTSYTAGASETAARSGWGVKIEGIAEVIRCVIARNSCLIQGNWYSVVSASGGGLFADGNVVLWECLIDGNGAEAYAPNRGSGERSYAYGAGLWIRGAARLRNCLLTRNYTYSKSTSPVFYGGGVYVESGSAHVENCTFLQNVPHGVWNAVQNPSPVNVEVTSSILYFNEGQQMNGAATIRYSDVQGGFTGLDNFDANPAVDPCDSRILPGSPCIDAGDPAEPMNDACRPPAQGTERNDVGAHGGPGNCDTPYCADCNGNGIADTYDIANGTSRDCNRNGIPDECDIGPGGTSTDCNYNGIPDACDITAGTATDADKDGVPDDCEASSAELVASEESGTVCYEFIFRPDRSWRGLETALSYNPTLLRFEGILPGEDLDPCFELSSCPGDCPSDPHSRCGGTRKGLTAYIKPTREECIEPAGTYRLFRLCFAILPAAPAGTTGLLRFESCLGTEDAPIRNVYTGEDLRSVPFFGISGDFHPGYFRRGDVNEDGWFDISDVIAILLCLFGGQPCTACRDAADTNDDAAFNIGDAVYLLEWRFRGGFPPPAPFPGCGLDPTRGDALGGCVYESCN